MKSENNPSPRFHFHLRSLLITVTIACVAIALVGRYGVEGFWARVGVALMILGVFTPLIEFYWWWQKNQEDDFK